MPYAKQFEIDVGWGHIRGQIFGNPDAGGKPILALHGFLDNSNSFKPVAPLITKNDQYYIIAIDLPGMGHSSNIPDGIPYSTKFFLMTLRRVVLHFNLNQFIFMTHSFGCSVALAYAACFQDQVKCMVLIDFAMKDASIEVRDNLADCWKEGIEVYLKAEKALKEAQNKPKRELTYDHALARLLESNKDIDETAAQILLERGLVEKDGQLEYSRDIRLVTGISFRDFHLEYRGVYDCLFTNLITPALFIYATPPPFGQKLFDQIMNIINEIKKNSHSDVETAPIEGTHHFHMLKPAETAEIVLGFLSRKVQDWEINNNIKPTSDATAN